MTTYDQATGRTTPADRAAGMRALSGLTAALVLGSVVGTGVIGVELLTHTGTTTASTSGTSAGVSAGTSSTSNGSFFGGDDGGDDGGRTSTAAGQSGQPGQASQSQGGTGLLGGLLGGGSGSPNATSGGS